MFLQLSGFNPFDAHSTNFVLYSDLDTALSEISGSPHLIFISENHNLFFSFPEDDVQFHLTFILIQGQC